MTSPQQVGMQKQAIIRCNVMTEKQQRTDLFTNKNIQPGIMEQLMMCHRKTS